MGSRMGKISAEEMISVGIAQASWQLECGQYEPALIVLQEMQKAAPDNPMVLRGLKNAYLDLAQWQKLQNLLPVLAKHHALTAEELERLEHQVYSALLQQAANNVVDNAADPHAIEDIWQKMPKPLQSDPELLLIYVQYLLTQQKSDKAEN